MSNFTLILGELNDINRYHLDEILSKYNKSYVVSKTNVDIDFSSYNRPIVGNLLFVVTKTDNVSLKEVNSIIANLYALEKKYIDVVYLIPNHRFTVESLGNTISDINIIDLKDTYRADFIKYLENTYKVDREKSRLVARQLGYSLKRVQENHMKLVNKDYSKIEKIKYLPMIQEVLYDILNKKQSGLHKFNTLSDKYSKNWLLEELKSLMLNILEFKKQVFIERKSLSKETKDDMIVSTIVKETPIYNVYRLYLLIDIHKEMGVIIYFKEVDLHTTHYTHL